VTTHLALASAINNIPDGWEVTRFRFVARLRTERNTQGTAPLLSLSAAHGLQERDEGGLGRQAPSDGSIPTYWLVRPGDIVINPMWLIEGGIAASNMFGAVSPAYRVYTPSSNADTRYLHHLLRSQPYLEQYNQHIRGVTTFDRSVTKDDLHDLPVILPSLEEQRRIADFLDAETSRIDSLLQERDKQRSALAEREVSIIASVLSGGASADTGKSTGWPWLPYIPTDWSVGPVYAYYATDLGKMLNKERSSGPNKKPYLRNANIHWYEIDISDVATMTFEPEDYHRYLLQPGDLLVCEGGAGIAEAAVWDGRIQECFYQKSLHRVRSISHLPVEWLMYWLKLAKYVGLFTAEGNIATIPHLTGEQLRSYRIPIPSNGNQLAARITKQITHIKEIDTSLKRAQELLQERRRALITAAVTGEFDVSTASGRGIED
jgi:type I restriction enzyme S subunit